MGRRRAIQIFIGILGLFLVGTVIVLSSISYYLFIDPSAYLSELEVPYIDDYSRINASSADRIPRIIHQTWKTDVIPEKWQPVSQSCRDLMPDYEYILWSDDSARRFISDYYPWFLDTYDHYPYNIQRADAIRYFVLHHYGGIYIDLDIGCRRPLDALLTYPVILPKTIPVGVSNDLMFAEKEHPFMTQTIHNLATFDHNWILNYPTVMFSTGPMFLSAQYSIYTSSHSNSIRILPKSLYGKNAKDGEAPHSFFSHYYGSSWHADDAGFIWFLGTKGKLLMWIGLVIVVLGILRLVMTSGKQRRSRYDSFLSRRSSRSGSSRWYIQLGSRGSESSSPPSSPDSASNPSSPIHPHMSFIPFSSRAHSPNRFEGSRGGFLGAIQKLRHALTGFAGPRQEDSLGSDRHSSRGILFFLPAIFPARSQDLELGTRSLSRSSDQHRPISSYPPEKQRYARDFERAGLSHLLDAGEPSPSNSSSGPSVQRSRSPSRSRSVSRHRDR